MADIQVLWDQAALAVWLHDIEAEHLPLLADEVASLARTLAPVRTRHTSVPRWARKGYIGRPGYLKGSVDFSVGQDFQGFYADVGSLWYGRFMDPKAKQLHYLRPFLPSALEWTLDGRVFYWDG